jgi:hypothetical protein
MTLGSVGKAPYSGFAGKRKLLIVPYVTPTREDPVLDEMVRTYWKDAITQVRKLETGLGEVRHVFHEGSVGEGPEATATLEQGNPHGYPELRRIFDAGAKLAQTEDIESLKETLDLHRCMAAVEMSQSVAQRLMEWLEDSRKNRYAAIGNRVSERLSENEVGMLIISPDHEVQFPGDIEVVYVVPPVLDKINKWLRDNPEKDGGAAMPDGINRGEDPPPVAEESSEDDSPDWVKG